MAELLKSPTACPVVSDSGRCEPQSVEKDRLSFLDLPDPCALFKLPPHLPDSIHMHCSSFLPKSANKKQFFQPFLSGGLLATCPTKAGKLRMTVWAKGRSKAKLE